MARDLHIDLSFLHVPGKTLVAKRVDAASRDGVKEIRGSTVCGALKDFGFHLADPLDWKISVDLFASNENRRATRAAIFRQIRGT